MVVFVIYKKIINKEAVYKISYKKLYCKIYHSIILSSNAIINSFVSVIIIEYLIS